MPTSTPDSVSIRRGESGWHRSPNATTDWWHLSGLSLTDLGVYHALTRYVERHRTTCSSIGRALGCKRQTIAASIARLNAARWVHVQYHLGPDGQYTALSIVLLSPQVGLQHALVQRGLLAPDVAWPADLTDEGAWRWAHEKIAATTTGAGGVRETDRGCPRHGQGVSATRTGGVRETDTVVDPLVDHTGDSSVEAAPPLLPLRAVEYRRSTRRATAATTAAVPATTPERAIERSDCRYTEAEREWRRQCADLQARLRACDDPSEREALLQERERLAEARPNRARIA